MDTDSIKKDIKDILNVFEKYGVKIYLTYGAFLGAVRDGKLIPWDDDIDFDVVDPVDLKTRKAIGWALYDIGFKTQPIAFNVFGRMESSLSGYNGDGQSGIIVVERNYKFSIFFYKQEGEDLNCYPMLGSVKLISIPIKFYYEPHGQIKLLGFKFLTPSPQKEYLGYVYGHDWKIPIRDLHAPNCIQGKQKHE